MEIASDTPAIATGNGRGKIRLLTRQALDGRTAAAKRFDAIAHGIANDLGGESKLTTIQQHLIEAFAGAALHVSDLNAKLLLGQDVDVVEHSQAISTMVRIASRLPINRVLPELPSMAERLRSLPPEPPPLPIEDSDNDD